MTNPVDPFETKLTAEEREALQEWAAAPAPGEERLADFRAPRLLRPRRAPRTRTLLWQAAAGLVLFYAGYFIGNAGTAQPENHHTQSAKISATAPQPSNRPAATTHAPAPTLVSAPAPVTVASTLSQKECQSPQIYKGADGRFRIETVLCQSGSHATWVINPRLELANAAQTNPEEDKQ